ncbi:extensin-like [Helianthus annuus]|uniref:extensin-like n=1 Tax=Helianthus annuus TaxID=4232 RepID=UPI000B90A2CF|nr:extensin-like [Helianthus annuus]
MPPRFLRTRGRGKGPVAAPNDHEAGPSNTRGPIPAESDGTQQNQRGLFQPARRSVSNSSTTPAQDSYGPQSKNEPGDSHHSYLPLQRSMSHRPFGDPTPFFQGQFNPANYIQEPVGFNPLGPEDHFYGGNDKDEEDDPVEPASGTPNHPIEVSDSSIYHGPPYDGPDSFQAIFTRHEWYYTPSHHSSPHEQQQQHHQDSSGNHQFVAVTPPPPPPPVQPAPPQPQRRMRAGARMSTRREEFHFSSPLQSSGRNYQPLQEVPQMGGPSNTVAQQPPPIGFDNQIPAYTGPSMYNPFEPPTHTNLGYAEADPYLVAANYIALNPEGPYGGPWGVGYPAQGYQIPTQPPYYQQPPPSLQMSPPLHQEILQSIREVRHEAREDRRRNQGMFKTLTNLIKGKSKKDQ